MSEMLVEIHFDKYCNIELLLKIYLTKLAVSQNECNFFDKVGHIKPNNILSL